MRALFRAKDLPALERLTHRNYELIRGELYEIVPPTVLHSETIAQIARLLLNWNDHARAGRVITEAGFRLERRPDTVRAPDRRIHCCRSDY